MKRLGEKTQLNIRRIFLVSFDVISIIIAAYGSLLLRFNGPIESQYLHRVNILIGSMDINWISNLYYFSSIS